MEIIVTTREDLKNLLTEILIAYKPIIPKIKTSEEEYITKKQAANFLQVSLATIDNYRRQGKIKSYKVGANVRFKKSELISSVTNQG